MDILVQILRDPIWGSIGIFIGIILAVASIVLGIVKKRTILGIILTVPLVAIIVSAIILAAIFPSTGSNASKSEYSLGHVFYTYHDHSGSINMIRWSPDGKLITSSSDDGTVQTWDAFSGGNVQMRPYHNAFLSGQVLEIPSPNGKYIASLIRPPLAEALDRVVVWNAQTGKDIFTYKAFEIGPVVWSSDSRYIASSSNMDIEVWNGITGKKILIYSGHYDSSCFACHTVSGIAWSPDLMSIASTSWDGKVLIWDVATGNTFGTYNCHCFALGITWSLADESRIIVGSEEADSNNSSHHSTIQLLHLTFGLPSINIMKQTNIVCPSSNHPFWGPIWEISPNNKYFAYTCSGSSQVNIWDLTTMQVVYTYEGHTDQVLAITWSPDGKYIASGGTDKTVQVWQAISNS